MFADSMGIPKCRGDEHCGARGEEEENRRTAILLRAIHHLCASTS